MAAAAAASAAGGEALNRGGGGNEACTCGLCGNHGGGWRLVMAGVAFLASMAWLIGVSIG